MSKNQTKASKDNKDDKPEGYIFGRPTKYRKKFCKELVDFFKANDLFTEIEMEHFKKGDVSWVDKKKVAGLLPTMEAFAESINVDVLTLRKWKKQHKDFSSAYTRAQQIQKNFLVQNGFAGLAPSNFVIFLAKNLTDLKDKQELDLTSGGKTLRIGFGAADGNSKNSK